MVDYEALNIEGDFQLILDHAEKELDTFEGRYWQVTALWRQGKYDLALELILEYLSAEDIEYSKDQQVQLIYRTGVIYWSYGQYQTALQHFQSVLDILGTFSESKIYADTLNVMGIIYFRQESEKVIPTLQEAIDRYKKLEEYSSVGLILVNLAAFYFNEGKLAKALDLYKESIDLLKLDGNTFRIASPLRGIGLIYKEMGRLDDALEYYRKSLKILEERGQIIEVAAIHGQIAGIYLRKGSLHQALKFNQKGLELLEETDDKSDLAICLSLLVENSTMIGDIELAKKYYNRLDDLKFKTEDVRIPFYKDFARGILLKSSKRLLDIAKAQEIFKHLIIVGQGMITYDVRASYIELLIAEYKSYQDEEVLQEIETQTTEMEKLATDQKIFPAILDVKILKSRLALINHKFDLAYEILNNALELSIARDMYSYIERIEKEQEKLETQLHELKKLIEDSSILDKIEQTHLEDYIKQIQRVR